MTRKNIEKLAELGKRLLKEELNKSLISMRIQRINLEQENIEEINKTRYCHWLCGAVEDYKIKVKTFKETYGAKFPDLQKEYEKMLPEIKKYLINKE